MNKEQCSCCAIELDDEDVFLLHDEIYCEECYREAIQEREDMRELKRFDRPEL